MNKNWQHKRPIFHAPPAVKSKKRKWVVLPIIWAALKRTCMALGAFVLISIIYGVIIASQFAGPQSPPLPKDMVMYLEFDGAFSELPVQPGFADPFALSPPTVREFVAAIDKAKDDKRVKGIYARLDGGGFALAHVQEVRDAIKRFKASGKFAHIYAQSYGGAGGGLGGYYLASAFDEIWLQPVGVVSITGLNLESPFLRSVLDKVGVEPHFFQRKEYKTAYENLTNSEISPENLEMMRDLLADIKAEFTKDIPAERGFSSALFTQHVNQGLFTAQEALEAKLVTHVDYQDNLIGRLKEEITGEPEYDEPLFVDVGSYLNEIKGAQSGGLMQGYISKKFSPGAAPTDKPKVALIYAVGAIMPDDGRGAQAPLGLGGNIAAADEIAPAILSAAKQEDIKAIVLRIDSPGGSPSASESILRAIEKAQDKGKLVIVSMGPVAASGGYWIAAYADQIFVLPTTITGSIGVIGGKFSGQALFEKLGVNWDGVRWGENAGMWSINEPFSDSEATRFNVMLDQIYDAFITRVSKGRKMDVDAVDRVAKGRVWSGARAVDVGLADQLGGLTEALNYTAQQFGKAHKSDLAITIFPAPKTPIEQFFELLSGSSSIYNGLRLQAQLGEAAAPFLQDISVINQSQNAAVYEPLKIR